MFTTQEDNTPSSVLDLPQGESGRMVSQIDFESSSMEVVEEEGPKSSLLAEKEKELQLRRTALCRDHMYRTVNKLVYDTGAAANLSCMTRRRPFHRHDVSAVFPATANNTAVIIGQNDAPITMQFRFETSDDYLNARNSFLFAKCRIGIDPTANHEWASNGVGYDHLCYPFAEGFGCQLDLVKRVTLRHKTGKVIDELKRNAGTVLNHRFDKLEHNLKQQMASLIMRDDCRYTARPTNIAGDQFHFELVLPFILLSDLFAQKDRLLPPQLMAGSWLEVELYSPYESIVNEDVDQSLPAPNDLEFNSIMNYQSQHARRLKESFRWELSDVRMRLDLMLPSSKVAETIAEQWATGGGLTFRFTATDVLQYLRYPHGEVFWTMYGDHRHTYRAEEFVYNESRADVTSVTQIWSCPRVEEDRRPDMHEYVHDSVEGHPVLDSTGGYRAWPVNPFIDETDINSRLVTRFVPIRYGQNTILPAANLSTPGPGTQNVWKQEQAIVGPFDVTYSQRLENLSSMWSADNEPTANCNGFTYNLKRSNGNLDHCGVATSNLLPITWASGSGNTAEVTNYQDYPFTDPLSGNPVTPAVPDLLRQIWGNFSSMILVNYTVTVNCGPDFSVFF